MNRVSWLALLASGSVWAGTSVIANGSPEIFVGAGRSNTVIDNIRMAHATATQEERKKNLFGTSEAMFSAY